MATKINAPILRSMVCFKDFLNMLLYYISYKDTINNYNFYKFYINALYQ